MRDEFEDDYVFADELPPTRRALIFQRISTWVGAGLAVALVFGGAFWTYRLIQRDASDLPVLHAALTPAKIQPDDPGGATTPHQGITSYSAGSTEGVAPRIAFAPPPERPADEDVAMGVLRDQQVAAVDLGTLTSGTAAPGRSAAAGFAPESSPLAPTRPTDLRNRFEAVQKAISAEQKLAASAAASEVQIQLGAYPSRDFTASEWDRIYRANVDVLNGRALVVQSTISGGQRFFRMRAGPFKDRIEAQNICRALQSRGQDCLVAVNG